MKIGMQTWGSDGDILQVIALAGGLSQAGHTVTLAITSVSNKDYSALASAMNIKLIKANEPFDVDMKRLFGEIMGTSDEIKQLEFLLGTYFDPVVEDMYKASTMLCKENDLVIGHFFSHTLLTASQKHGCPRVSVAFSPGVIRTRYLSPLGINFGTLVNRAIWNIADYLIRRKCFLAAEALRVQEGLPRLKSLGKELYISDDLTLLATSRALSTSQPDWGENIQLCGSFNIPSVVPDWEMPDDLRLFLDAGEPPVYITFGSCTQFDLESSTRLFVEGIQRSGRRAIIQSDWESIPAIEDDPNIYRVKRIPHQQVFPFCSMVVHHGGAGTTQGALRSGKPSLVVEHAFDQTYWGEQLKKVGVAGKVLHRRSLTAEKLTRGIDDVLSSSDMKKNAQRLGSIMREEDGVGRAVKLIESRFQSS